MLSHELLLSIEESVSPNRTVLWKGRWTWHWSITSSLPVLGAFTQKRSIHVCFLSSVTCHKSKIRGSRVKKHQISKAFPRKGSEKTVCCLCLQVYKLLSKWDSMTYILKKEETIGSDLYLWEDFLLFPLPCSHIHTVTENTCLLKKASLGLNPGKPYELWQALRDLKQQKIEWIIMPHYLMPTLKKKTDKQSPLQMVLSGILTSLPTNSYWVLSMCRRWRYSCQPGGKAPTLMELQPKEDDNRR